MTNSLITSAVVLDIGFSGYGVIRSLSRYNIPIIGFKTKKFSFEAGTRLCETILVFKDMHHLYEMLISYAKTQSQKPVLYLTSDKYVYFISENITEINKYYQIDFPNESIINILMDKLNFTHFAIKNNLKIPRTIDLCETTNIQIFKDKLNFPLVLKPWLRTDKWNKNIKEKAFLLSTYNKLEEVFEMVKKIEKNILIQEYIPGGDDHIYYCLTYYDQQSNCISAFTGKKIRQWPIKTGSTATTIACENDTLKNETTKIFDLLNYKGFGSIEYKKHAITGEYYIMEPTVGRLNQQEYVATLNGNNLPLIAYNSLTRAGFEPILSKKKPIIYIDEINELRSAFKYFKEGNLTIKEWLKSIKGYKAYRYCNFNDPMVGMRLIFLPFVAISKIIKWMLLAFAVVVHKLGIHQKDTSRG